MTFALGIHRLELALASACPPIEWTISVDERRSVIRGA